MLSLVIIYCFCIQGFVFNYRFIINRYKIIFVVFHFLIIGFKMPRFKPITRSSNKDPFQVTLSYLDEHIKYLQRCYRCSEKKNLQLELELESF